ncbi:LCP family protein [Nocardioides nematodiphilus]|uniref:LCP family protein n=1 Tax=Nocardioides nematodiphilus TaxID=2849669 RepID=UPI001CD94CC3|nr:LCP family protein [Nocardioides nematodiphilus]MCA1983062.1 LCP family protein [Nocardioides nematodiphilus]
MSSTTEREPGTALEDLLTADSPTDGSAPEQAPAPARRRRRRSPLKRVILWLLACGMFLAAVPLTVALYVGWRLDHNMHRIDGVFNGLTNRPVKAAGAGGAVDILLLGTDLRSDVPTTGTDGSAPAWVPGADRADTMMLLHIAADRRSASVISIPRDSWVPIPGHGNAKINAALSYGGPSLAVETVEQLTGVHVDHLAVIDWSGFIALTDAVGGVDVDIPATVHDSARNITWTAGRHHLDGAHALLYLRQRYGLPGGDLDRVARQQAFLRTLMSDSLHQEMRKDPTMLYDFLDTITKHVSVDSDWSTTSMAKLLVSMRNMRSLDIGYLTAPIAGFGREGAQDVVRLAPAADADLWEAVRADRMPQWSAIHWADLTPDVVD